jgi:hypothetical protein
MVNDPKKRDELLGIGSKVNFLCIYAHILTYPCFRGSLDQWRNQEYTFNRCKPPQGPYPQVRFTKPTRRHNHQASYHCYEVEGGNGIESSTPCSMALPNRSTR